jgi:integrase/recombinase XerD
LVYHDIVLKYAREVGITEKVHGFCVHSLRATAGTNALEHGADIAGVQVRMGHANVSTTRLYEKRRRRPEESPPRKVRY